MSRPPLFIHIPKNAGNSVIATNAVIPITDKALKDSIKQQQEMDPVAATTVSSIFGRRMIKHTPYNYLDREYLNRFDRVFAVIRNPWSRLVSLYNYADYISSEPELKSTWYAKPKISWDEYIDRMDIFKMTPNYFWIHPYDHWALQSDWLPTKGKVDILRYENLQEDLNSYLGKQIELPYLNKGKEADYKSYYTEEQKQKVANWFRLDIDRFGFDFETGATKNYWMT